MTMISLKVSPEKLERIDAEAKRLGITRTDLLLRPFTNTLIPHAKIGEWNTPQNNAGLPEIKGLADRFNAALRPKHALDCKCLMCKPPK